MQSIGFVGLGRMGQPIARRLLAAGFPLTVYDENAAATQPLVAQGARLAASTAAVADVTDIVVICLPMPDIVRAVATGSGGFIEGRRARHLIDISTTGPRIAREIDDALSAAGKAFVDSPMTGGVAGAISGKLTLMVGAAPEAAEAVKPVLDVIGNNVLVAGARPGDGQMLKVINNTLSFIALEATAEAMVLGVRYGLNAETMLNAFNNGTGRNSATEEKFPRSVMPRSFNFGFSVRSVNKDVGLCLAEAEALGVPMPVGTCAKQIWTAAMAEMGDEDMTSIVKIFERWAGGVVVKAD